MTIATRLKRIEAYVGEKIENNAEYTLVMGADVEEHTYFKAINGITQEITRAEFSAAVDKIIKICSIKGEDVPLNVILPEELQE